MLVYHEIVSDCLTPIQQFFSYIMATVKEKMFLRKALCIEFLISKDLVGSSLIGQLKI
jgi:hypothetical protein